MVVARIAVTVYEAFGHWRADHRKGKTLLSCWPATTVYGAFGHWREDRWKGMGEWREWIPVGFLPVLSKTLCEVNCRMTVYAAWEGLVDATTWIGKMVNGR
jgi:hypothetical protein